MTYAVIWQPQASKQAESLDYTIARRIHQAVGKLASAPRPSGCTKLAGAADLWRIRVGQYRVVYAIRDRELVVLVVRVGHRREVYR